MADLEVLGGHLPLKRCLQIVIIVQPLWSLHSVRSYRGYKTTIRQKSIYRRLPRFRDINCL